jgi:hypothetical protein
MALRSMNAPGSPSSALQMMYFGVAFSAAVSFHLRPVGKPAPPAPAQPRLLHFRDHLLRRHICDRLGQGLVAPQGQIVVDVLRVDDAAVAQRDSHLLAEEFRVAENPEETVVQMVLLNRQPRERTAVDQMFFHDLRNVVFRHPAVDRVARVDDQDRAFVAHAQAAGQADGRLVGQPVLGQLLLQGGRQSPRPAVDAGGPIAEDNSVRCYIHDVFPS